MNRKIIVKYLLLCLPFIIGASLYCFSVFNLFSSLLFFCGGYVVLKNILDYRKINKIKNSDKSVISNKYSYEKDFSYRNSKNIIGLKRTRRHYRVRKRVK